MRKSYNKWFDQPENKFSVFYDKLQRKRAYFFNIRNSERSNKEIAMSIDLLKMICERKNLNVLSIGPGNGQIESFLEDSGIMVLGIGKDGSKHDSGIPFLKNTFNVAQDFICTEESVKTLFKTRALPNMAIENFENTVLLVFMPPPPDYDTGKNEDFAYYFQQFAAMQG